MRRPPAAAKSIPSVQRVHRRERANRSPRSPESRGRSEPETERVEHAQRPEEERAALALEAALDAAQPADALDATSLPHGTADVLPAKLDTWLMAAGSREVHQVLPRETWSSPPLPRRPWFGLSTWADTALGEDFAKRRHDISASKGSASSGESLVQNGSVPLRDSERRRLLLEGPASCLSDRAIQCGDKAISSAKDIDADSRSAREDDLGPYLVQLGIDSPELQWIAAEMRDLPLPEGAAMLRGEQSPSLDAVAGWASKRIPATEIPPQRFRVPVRTLYWPEDEEPSEFTDGSWITASHPYHDVFDHIVSVSRRALGAFDPSSYAEAATNAWVRQHEKLLMTAYRRENLTKESEKEIHFRLRLGYRLLQRLHKKLRRKSASRCSEASVSTMQPDDGV
eukprot:TRINITY_DN68012_c0_g1_i1.p1 TRINITY_DN68012_c0_g1~~TRINITY_DN68012_c0_g1_i1.p1  ORF type:complete len:398 (+),score=48.47 TRINITY_DN68012_c0_g1_i1:110-1303(+)